MRVFYKQTYTLFSGSPSARNGKGHSSTDSTQSQNRESRVRKYLNVDKNVHYSNQHFRAFCVLCMKSTRRIVQHHVRNHPQSEFPLARISKKMMDMCASPDSALKRATRGFNSTQNAICVFCEKKQSFHKSVWLDHMYWHVGQLSYKCNKCNRTYSSKCYHYKAMSCKPLSWTKIRRDEIDGQCIYAFACMICYYVQMDRQRLVEHIQHNHDITERAAIDGHCRKIPILKMHYTRKYNMSQRISVSQNSSKHVTKEVATNTDEIFHGIDSRDPKSSISKEVSQIPPTPQQDNIPPADEIDDISADSPILEEMSNSYDSTSSYSKISSTSNTTRSIFSDDDATQDVQSSASTSAFISHIEEESTRESIDDGGANHGESIQRKIGQNSEQETALTMSVDEIHEISSDSEVENDEGASGNRIVLVDVQTQLKPWTGTKSKKTAEVIDHLLCDVSMFALFKCMGRNCGFSSDQKDQMDKHLELHDNAGNRNAREYLECAYCERKEKSPNDLLNHITETHAGSVYQCQYCFYRSVDAYSVLIHQEMYHEDRERLILFCKSNGMATQEIGKQLVQIKANQLEEAQKQLVAMVQPIRCECRKWLLKM